MHTLKRVRVVCRECGALLEALATERSSNERFKCGACECEFAAESSSSLVEPTLLPGFAPPSGIAKGVTLDQVLLPAISLLKSHWLPLLCMSFIVNAFWVAVIGWPAKFLWSQWSTLLGDESADLVSLGSVFAATCAVGILAAPVSSYTMMAMARLSLRIARYGNHDRVTVRSSIADLRVPFMAVMRVSVILVGLGVILGSVLVGGLLMTIALSLALDPQSATLIGTLGMGTALIGFVFLMQWLIWPSIFLISDERATLMTALTWGTRLAREYRSLSLSLVTVYFLMATLGSLLFYVGQIATTPVAMLPMAIGYLRMTGGQNF